MLLLIGPFLDKLISGKWVWDYELSVPSLACLVLSCTIAAMVNLSQFICLG